MTRTKAKRKPMIENRHPATSWKPDPNKPAYGYLRWAHQMAPWVPLRHRYKYQPPISHLALNNTEHGICGVTKLTTPSRDAIPPRLCRRCEKAFRALFPGMPWPYTLQQQLFVELPLTVALEGQGGVGGVGGGNPNQTPGPHPNIQQTDPKTPPAGTPASGRARKPDHRPQDTVIYGVPPDSPEPLDHEGDHIA